MNWQRGRSVPALWLAGSAYVGALLGAQLQLPAPALWALAFLCVAAAVAVVAAQRPAARALWLLALSLLATLSHAGWVQFQHARTASTLPVDVSVYEGTVADVLAYPSGRVRVALDVTGVLARSGASAPLVASMEAWLPPGAPQVLIGDVIRVRGRARLPDVALVPGDFDSARHAFARGLDASLSVVAPLDVATMQRPPPTWRFARVRQGLRDRISALTTPREAGLLLALLVGDTALIEPEQRIWYRDTGAGHLLAVSGLQVSLLALLLRSLLVPLCLLLPSLRLRAGAAPRVAHALAIALVWAFVATCGMPPSAVRAGIMASVVLLAPLLSRRVRILDALGVAMAFTLYAQPQSAVDASFVLSYGAVIGLVACAPVKGASLRARLTGALLSTFAAAAVTLPLSAYLFGMVAPGGILANVVLVPVASLFQVPALVCGIAGAAVGSGTILWIGAQSALLIEALLLGLYRLLGGVWLVTAPSALTTFALTVLCIVLVVSWSRRWWRLSVVTTLLACALLAVAQHQPRGLHVWFLPVGQGDATVVRTPSGHTIVVDGGGEFLAEGDKGKDPGRDVVLPFLARIGVSTIDVAVLSHPHPDHAMGLVTVLESMPPKQMWTNGADRGFIVERLQRALPATTEQKSTPALLGSHRFGETTIEVIAPAPDEGTALYPELSANDNSLVLRVCFEGACVLLPGDIEALSEDLLLNTARSQLPAALIKAPHHGSITSSTVPFVNAVAPKHVVFCTGRGNTFYFPNGEVLDRYRAVSAELWDTAVHGEVHAVLAGGDIHVEGFQTGRVQAPHRPEP